jgi:hypothetical protein
MQLVTRKTRPLIVDHLPYSETGWKDVVHGGYGLAPDQKRFWRRYVFAGVVLARL